MMNRTTLDEKKNVYLPLRKFCYSFLPLWGCINVVRVSTPMLIHYENLGDNVVPWNLNLKNIKIFFNYLKKSKTKKSRFKPSGVIGVYKDPKVKLAAAFSHLSLRKISLQRKTWGTKSWLKVNLRAKWTQVLQSATTLFEL